METKELIFNGKKFFEGQVPNYIGKTIKPTTSKINWFYYLETDPGKENQIFTVNGTMKGIPEGKVVAQFLNPFTQKVFLLTDGYGNGGSWGQKKESDISVSAWFKLDDIFQNGGVSTSYITTLCSTRKELVA